MVTTQEKIHQINVQKKKASEFSVVVNFLKGGELCQLVWIV